MKPLTTIRDRIFGPPWSEEEKRANLWPTPSSFMPQAVTTERITPQQKADFIHQRAAKRAAHAGRADTVRGIVGSMISTHIAPHGWQYNADEIAFLTENRVPATVVDTILDRIPSKRQVPVSDYHLYAIQLLFNVGSSVWRDVDLTPYRGQPDYLDDYRPPFDVEDFAR